MKSSTPWSVGKTFAAIAAVSGVVSLVIAMFLASLNATGHGSGLPFTVYAAPMGLGLFIWPITFLLAGLPRRWLWWALGAAVLLVIVRAVGAYAAFANGYDDLGRIGALQIAVEGIWTLSAVVSLMSPVCIVLRLLTREQPDKTSGMRPVISATKRSSTPP